MNPRIHESWKKHLIGEFNEPYFSDLKKFLVVEKNTQQVYPPGDKIFAAFDRTPFEDVKVVILGQDPYHGKGQAHGLCFSVPQDINPPPSLVNIFKELHNNLGIPMPSHGNLESWADQGVLLLNATLTVRANQAGSHQNRGWEIFTDAAIRKLSENREGLIFILWGRYAQAKEHLIDAGRHHILKAAHPSPFSAHSGFFGCKHFSKTNEILESQGKELVDWSLG
ncbi:uracil-DNA glycosylase [Bacteroidota bacterium]